MENQDPLHHERKSPFPLTAEALQPAKSTDEILVHYDVGQSHLRTAQAGRMIYCYEVTNVTKRHQYNVELLEDVHDKPYGWCNCQATVVCKHIRAALAMLRSDVPEFGKAVFPARATLEYAAAAALAILTDSPLEYAVVFTSRPDYTICDMLREALGHPPQDRSDRT